MASKDKFSDEKKKHIATIRAKKNQRRRKRKAVNAKKRELYDGRLKPRKKVVSL